MKKLLIISALMLLLSSCSILDAGLGLFNDNVDIGWKGDNTGEPVDSVKIVYHGAYLEINKSQIDSSKSRFYLHTDKDGYNIWILEDENTWFIDVIKNDTTIYFYEK
jgi:hypothetical protein